MSISVFNKFISDSKSFVSGVQGSVSIFTYEGDIYAALSNNGFKQVSVREGGEFGAKRLTNQWGNDDTNEGVFLSNKGLPEFTYSDTECNPL